MNAITENTEIETLDLGAMMEQTLDDIPDAPDFVTPPAGEYQLMLKEAKIETYTAKAKGEDEGGERQRLKILYTIVETMAVSGNEPPVPNESMFSETFQGTKQGLSYFKTRLKNIMNVSDLNGVSLGDMMDSAKGTIFHAKISIRKTPKEGSPGEFYENVNIKVVPPAAY